ncbi:DUF6934 family protein [Flavobacterium pectinovorum]|uniref:Uncharacterized protein n=1 Tax=Flavobacterium pectinovorum TaxID=29533 RepID=A0A502ELE1_9FLAO|nr:hypothetical protein [Flavobacterium pectinovorum]TPG37802.1 hypothetical protein EAH81_17880 [Flavobacterium pectinovorum]
MEDLINSSYDFELVDNNLTNIKYDFVSSGKRQILKRVALRQYEAFGLEKYYNLGFGNLSIDEYGNEKISDMSRENNLGDKDKVLQTVFICALDFLSISPNSIVTFYGNTFSKHRLYKISLNKNLLALQKYFIVKGGIIKDLKVKETIKGKDVLSRINIDNIIYEPYAPNNSRDYNFITFELIETLK